MVKFIVIIIFINILLNGDAKEEIKESDSIGQCIARSRTTETSPVLTADCIIKCRNQFDNQESDAMSSVCGTDGKTYDDSIFLKCAQLCGKRVHIKYYGPCCAEAEDSILGRMLLEPRRVRPRNLSQ